MNRIRQATDNYVVLDSAIVYSRRFDVRIIALPSNPTTLIITLGWMKIHCQFLDFEFSEKSKIVRLSERKSVS